MSQRDQAVPTEGNEGLQKSTLLDSSRGVPGSGATDNPHDPFKLSQSTQPAPAGHPAWLTGDAL